MELCFSIRQILFSLLLFGDVCHHRDRATSVHPATQNAIPPAVRCVILEAPPRRIAQTFHALGDQGLDVTVAVVAVLGQMAQQGGIGSAGLQQRRRDLVHLFEAIVADDDVEIGVRVDERARHVVEHEMELAVCIDRIVIGHIYAGQNDATGGAPKSVAQRRRWTFVMAPPLVPFQAVYARNALLRRAIRVSAGSGVASIQTLGLSDRDDMQKLDEQIHGRVHYLNRKLSRESWLIEARPISFMPRSISVRRSPSARSTPASPAAAKGKR